MTRYREAFAKSGQKGFLEQELEVATDASRAKYVDPYWIAELYARLGARDQAFQWMENAYQERSHKVALINTEPVFDELHSDPRFRGLLRRLNLAN
jgi:hypothetical protein